MRKRIIGFPRSNFFLRCQRNFFLQTDFEPVDYIMRLRKSAAQDDASRTTGDYRGENGKTEKSGLFSSSRTIFLFCLGVRIINSLLIQTYFNPDEHWQALEVAHHIVFGYGHLTWEWKKGIRSYLHPMLFALLYKVLALLHLDTPLIMRKAPRLLQSLFSAVGDLYLYKLSHVLLGGDVAKWAIFSQLTNWFMFYCFTRTFSNSLETVLTLISLFYWPCLRDKPNNGQSASRRRALAFAALACAIRPTSAITWLYIGFLELLLARDRAKFVFLEGFPVMVFTFLPFSVAGILKSKQWKLFGLMAWVLGLYSVLGHKEFRFVLPVLPLALMFSGYRLAALGRAGSENKVKGSSKAGPVCSWKLPLSVIFLLVSNTPMALYMSLGHQERIEFNGCSCDNHKHMMCFVVHLRGAEDVMSYLSEEALDEKVQSILFLMPCHATPYYSSLHINLPMRFLDCTPSEQREVLDESKRFMADPIGFTEEYARNWSTPSHIVMFDSEGRLLQEFLLLNSFKEIKRFFHAHFKVDHDLQSSVVVYALREE